MKSAYGVPNAEGNPCLTLPRSSGELRLDDLSFGDRFDYSFRVVKFAAANAVALLIVSFFAFLSIVRRAVDKFSGPGRHRKSMGISAALSVASVVAVYAFGESPVEIAWWQFGAIVNALRSMLVLPFYVSGVRWFLREAFVLEFHPFRKPSPDAWISALGRFGLFSCLFAWPVVFVGRNAPASWIVAGCLVLALSSLAILRAFGRADIGWRR